MKKLIVVVAIAATAFVSAKNGEKINEPKDVEKKEAATREASDEDTPPDDTVMQCYEYSMYIPCQDTYINDTQCWGAGSGIATWEDAYNCARRNGVLAVDYFCGSGY